MTVQRTPLAGVFLISPKRFYDNRGFFSESFNKQRMAEAGLATDFLQDNLSFSATKGTMRGLHFQCPPFAQVKLLTVLSGAILDVVVDLRSGSPTFGKHFAVKLSADDGTQIFIPEGFAHGFYTHAPNTLVFYKASKYYSPDYEAGIRWDDESLNIDWGADPSTVTISDRDSKLPAFDPLADYFGDL